MKKILKFIGILAVFSCITGWVFYADHFAIDKTNRYRPLANGWVSYHAAMYLREEGNFINKVRTAISDDLIHGRFRPAFTFYVSSPYALSPIIHKRSVSSEGRSYDRLVNGDLRLFSYILLGSIALSFLFMSLLIYSYTKEVVFSFIPVCFIPLSPSLTENLLQNYIDSQEIPLVLWLSVWMCFLLLAVKTEKKWRMTGYLIVSALFLLLAFLTKETALILSVALTAVTIMIACTGDKRKSGIISFFIMSVIAVACSFSVYLIVSLNNKGYAANYGALKITVIQEALTALWNGFSKYSLNNLYGYIPICLFFFIAVKERKKTLNKISMSKHVALLVLLLLLCVGFFLILVPWRPILIKYLFPSIFFFSFAVAFSLSFLTAWSKKRFGKKGYVLYILLLPYLFYYNTIYARAKQERDYWADTASYGVSVVDKLAESIEREVNNSVKQQSIFLEYGNSVDWANNIPWAKLHLMRILNLDKRINLVQQNGSSILNYQMPKAELTSLREYENGQKLYLSNNPHEISTHKFDVVYKGYRVNQRPQSEFDVNVNTEKICYQITGERIDWQGRSHSLPEFSLYQYKLAGCKTSSRNSFSGGK